MTETTSPQQDGPTRPGVDTEHLRNYERLRRSTTDRKIAGVAGGLGRHLNIDPTILRVLFVVLVFFGGAGLLLYGAAWLIVPEEGSERSVVHTSPSTRNALLIVAAVVAGLLLLGDSWGGFGFPWPLALVGVVVLAVLATRDRGGTQQPAAPPAATPADPGPGSPGTPPPAPSPTPSGDDTGTHLQEHTAMTTTYQQPPVGPPTAPPTWSAPPPPPARPSRRERGPLLFGITLALVALALGALGLVDASGISVAEAAYPALALTVVGLMLVLGSVFGRPGGLILLGIVAAIALAVTSAVDGNWNDQRTIERAPLAAGQLRGDYSLTAGEIDLDLTRIADLDSLDGRTVRLHAEAGEIQVTVPQGVDVDVNADIRFGGEAEVDGHIENGNGVELQRTIDGGTDVPQLTIDADLLVGHIVVNQEDAA